MSRATMFGERLLRILGGNNDPVYFVLDQNYGEDLDRGVRGSEAKCTKELLPRPTLVPVSGSLITRQAAVLKVGDYSLEISGSQVTECDLQNRSSRLQVGDQEFRIIIYNTNYVGGDIAFFNVFVRGISS